MRSPFAALRPLSETLDLLRGAVTPVPPRTLPLPAARGRIAAETVRAAQAVPETPSALRDGYAVEASAIAGASVYAPVLLLRAPPWIEAGAALPAGTDAVLPAEGLEGRNAVAEAGAWEGIRAAGEDVAAGDVLIAAGERIGPLHLLALGAAGHDGLSVRVPRLRLVATGLDGPEFLTATLAALIAARGGTAEAVVVPDEEAAIAAALLDGEADAVFVIGGTGFGRTDRSAAALERAGGVTVHGVALRPGETAALGAAGGRPVLLLPGRPEAALAAFLALGHPLLAALSGAREPPNRPAPLLRKIVSAIGLTEIVFVRRRAEGIEPLGGAGLPLRRLVEADGAVLVPPESEGYAEGSQVEVVLL